jgi:hypothetical protein
MIVPTAGKMTEIGLALDILVMKAGVLAFST